MSMFESKEPRASRYIASALLERNGSYLFIKQSKPGGAYPETLHIPGGGIEPGETPAEAVQREVWEEIGVKVDTFDPVDFAWDTVKYKGELTTLVFLRFFGKLPLSCTPHPSSDAREIIWLQRDELSNAPHNPATLTLLRALKLI